MSLFLKRVLLHITFWVGGYYTTLIVPRMYNVEDKMSDEQWFRKNLEGSGRGLNGVPSRHFLGRTEKLNKNPQSEYPMFRIGFEPNASPIRVFNAASTQVGSVP
jgi:hypothetical protein